MIVTRSLTVAVFRIRFRCSTDNFGSCHAYEAPDDIQEKLFAGDMAIGTAFKKYQEKKKREAAREARRQTRESEEEAKPVKTPENPEGIVGGEPVYHNGELMPGVMRTSAGIVHASRPYDDNPESFPYVMDLVERAVSSFDALIQNAMGKLSAGMLTEENRKELEKAIRAASCLGKHTESFFARTGGQK